jgi:WD40 repeat protein
VTAVAYAADGKSVAACDEKGSLIVWDPISGKDIQVVLGQDYERRGGETYLTAVALSPDGKLVASAGRDRPVRIQEIASREPIEILFPGQTVEDLAFSPDSKLLAFSSPEGTKVVDAKKKAEVVTLASHGHLAFTADGKSIAIATPSAVELHDLATGQLARTIPGIEIDGASKVAAFGLSADGTAVAVRAGDAVRVVTIATGTEIRHVSIEPAGAAAGASAFSPDLSRVVTCDAAAEEIRVNDTTTGKLETRSPCMDPIAAVAFAPDGKAVAAGGKDGLVHSLAVPELAPRASPEALEGHVRTVTSIGFSPDGKAIVTASPDGTARVWELAKRAERLTLVEKRKGAGGACATFTSDGKAIASGGAGEARLRLVDLFSGKPVRETSAPGGLDVLANAGPALVGFSRSAGEVTAWSGDATAMSARKKVGAFGPCAASSASGRVAVGATGKVIILEAPALVEVATLEAGKGAITALALSPQGDLIAVASTDDPLVRVLELGTRQELRTIKKDEHATMLAFSPDGKRLACGYDNGEAIVHEVRSAKDKSLETWGHLLPVTALAFAPDGKTLATASADTTVVLWKAE